jgi:hypothetical protein
MEPKTRKKLESLLWKYTHKDFRGSIDGVKNVLVNRGREGTCLVPLSVLTDDELLGKIPKRLMCVKDERRAGDALIRRWVIEGIEFMETCRPFVPPTWEPVSKDEQL